MKYSYYPGCTLRTKAKDLDTYARACASVLGFELEENREDGSPDMECEETGSICSLLEEPEEAQVVGDVSNVWWLSTGLEGDYLHLNGHQ